MKFEDVKNLIMLIRENDIAEVEIEEPDLRIKIKRYSSPDAINAGHQEYSAVFKSGSSEQTVTKEENVPGDTGAESFEEDRYKKVYSPLVGTFYRAPSPDAEPFVKEGDIIQKGAVICIIEAMKVMNEIESEHSGRVVAVPVDNGTPVEYGEPICIIDPFV